MFRTDENSITIFSHSNTILLTTYNLFYSSLKLNLNKLLNTICNVKWIKLIKIIIYLIILKNWKTFAKGKFIAVIIFL